MRLSAYISRQGTSASALAIAAKVAPSTVLRLLNVGMMPQRATAAKIAAATNGEVTEADLIAEAAEVRSRQAAA